MVSDVCTPLIDLFSLDGNNLTLKRDPMTGRLDCVCGNPHHARFDRYQIMNMCRRKDHPEDSDECPDTDEEVQKVRATKSRSLFLMDVSGSASPYASTSMNVSNDSLVSHSSDGSVPDSTVGQSDMEIDPPDDHVAAQDLLVPEINIDVSTIYQPAERPTQPMHQDELVPPDTVDCTETLDVRLELISLSAVDRADEDIIVGIPDDICQDLVALEDFAATSQLDIDMRDEVISPERFADIEATLQAASLQVHPLYKITICLSCNTAIPFNFASTHVRNHMHEYRIHHSFRIEQLSQLQDMLFDLGANEPRRLPSPISQSIPGLLVVDAYKCGLPNCHRPDLVAPAPHHFTKHIHEHGQATCRKRFLVSVKAHPIYNFRGNRYHVEVLMVPEFPHSSVMKAILADFQQKSGPQTTVYAPPLAKAMQSFVRELRWDVYLLGVDIVPLRSTVQTPTEAEPCLRRMHHLTHQYYSRTQKVMDGLPVVVLRKIRTKDYKCVALWLFFVSVPQFVSAVGPSKRIRSRFCKNPRRSIPTQLH